MQLGETALASNFFNVAILALSGQELYFLTLTLNDEVQFRRQKTRFGRRFLARVPLPRIFCTTKFLRTPIRPNVIIKSWCLCKTSLNLALIFCGIAEE